MLVGFQMDQAKLGKEIQAALREKEDEATRWKQLYLKAQGKHEEESVTAGDGFAEASAAEGGEAPAGDNGPTAAGALGVDEIVKLRSQVGGHALCKLEGFLTGRERRSAVRSLGGAVMTKSDDRFFWSIENRSLPRDTVFLSTGGSVGAGE